MALYVCTILRNANVVRADVIEADNDGQAVDRAMGMALGMPGHGYEVWRGGKKIGAYYYPNVASPLPPTTQAAT